MSSYYDDAQRRHELGQGMDGLALALRVGSVELFDRGEWIYLLQAAAGLAGALADGSPEPPPGGLHCDICHVTYPDPHEPHPATP